MKVFNTIVELLLKNEEIKNEFYDFNLLKIVKKYFKDHITDILEEEYIKQHDKEAKKPIEEPKTTEDENNDSMKKNNEQSQQSKNKDLKTNNNVINKNSNNDFLEDVNEEEINNFIGELLDNVSFRIKTVVEK